MFDRSLQNRLAPLVNRLVAPLYARGVKAVHISLIGLLFAFFSFFALIFGYFTLALGFILLNRLCDGCDGALARREGATPFGAFLDSAFDFIFYGLVPLGFALHAAQNTLPACLLLFAFYLNGGFFLSFAALTQEKSPQKGFYYLGGLTEGGETILFFASFCLFPFYFSWLAYGFAALCLISAIGRLFLAQRLLKIRD